MIWAVNYSELSKQISCKGCKGKKSDKLINKLHYLLNEYKLFGSLNRLINKGYYIEITKSSNELLEKLKLIENCTDCKYNKRKHYSDEFYKSVNELEYLFSVLLEEEQKRNRKSTYNR